jgi:cation transport regulator ChaC
MAKTSLRSYRLQVIPHRHWVFAYGSNMHLADLHSWFERTGHPLVVHGVERALLVEHRLVWNYYSQRRAGGAANVERRRDTQVWGAALSIDPSSLHGFDRKEGHPRIYRRIERPIRLARGPWVAAWVYTVTRAHRRTGLVAPEPHYHSLLLQGAAQLQLPERYQAELRSLQKR